MADLNITTPGAVVPTNANTVIARGTAGALIAAGQALYMDATANNVLKPAAQTSAATAAVVGIAVNGASTGQPVEYVTSGDLTFQASLLAQGKVYVQGSGSGGISLSADLDSATTNTRYGTELGVATSATNLRVGIVVSGVLRP